MTRATSGALPSETSPGELEQVLVLNIINHMQNILRVGPGVSGYSVERIDGSSDLIISAAIMAGFLPSADTEELRQEINAQLETMYTNDICAYPVTLQSGEKPKILWRCSARVPDWRCPSVDSIDFSTMILGFASNFLPADFYNKYAA